MTNQDNLPTKKRLNITILNGNVDEIEQLRSLMEKHHSKRFSIAEVIRMATTEALAKYTNS